MPSAGSRISPGTATLAVGKPELAAPLVAVGDEAAHLVGPAEHARWPGEVALAQARRGWRWTRPAPSRRPGRPSAPTRSSPTTVEAELRAQLGQQRDVALALVPEVEVLADHHGPGAEAVDQHLA